VGGLKDYGAVVRVPPVPGKEATLGGEGFCIALQGLISDICNLRVPEAAFACSSTLGFADSRFQRLNLCPLA
jgi:hypothetical protein